MKNTTITLLGLSLCALAPLALAQNDAPTPAEETPAAAPATPAPTDAEIKEVISYFLGFQTGIQFANFGEGPVQADDFDKEVFFKALADGLKNQVDPAMREKDLQANVAAFGAKLAARNSQLSEANKAASKAFFEENGKKEGVVTTDSGLQYKVLTPAPEGRKYDEAKDGKNVQAMVTYEGRLLNGTVFDQADEPLPVSLNGVIPGFAEALKLMPIGSEWEVYIPSELAYGEHGPGVLGANAALIFKLKLHDLKAAPAPAETPIELTPEMLEQLKAAGMQPVEQ